MKRKRFTPEQIIAILHEHRAGPSAVDHRLARYGAASVPPALPSICCQFTSR